MKRYMETLLNGVSSFLPRHNDKNKTNCERKLNKKNKYNMKIIKHSDLLLMACLF